MHNPANRRIRTRMSGGVGGEEPRGSPLSRLPGNDEMEEACGDGWAELQPDGTVEGQILRPWW
jgi:hypothetical protein